MNFANDWAVSWKNILHKRAFKLKWIKAKHKSTCVLLIQEHLISNFFFT